MKIEVLVSTMNQTNHDLLRKMNIMSNAIFINQCNKNQFEEFFYNENLIKFLSFNERGVGLSRNTALMRSNADICILADDDLVYEQNYYKSVVEEFKRNPEADVIIFTVDIVDNEGVKTKKLKRKRVHFFNSLSYGAVRIAFRREKIIKNNIFFSLIFGGGAKYGSGEDTIFIKTCLDKGLKIYTSPVKIATVYNHDSSWFKGYNTKYFMDKGALFYSLSKVIYIPLCLQYLVRHRRILSNNMNFAKAFSLMLQGAKEFRT